MEVTHVQDHVTHAVIGGGKAESFGISDDPAFFHVLSSTLYRDKQRAVARETLCNAWDAHIEAGLINMPIEVTLTNNKLTIRDFGEGIDKSMIKPIYGVYGASTKKKNQNVTGGFGLGCKAPFAYVDHFEVTSCHLGEKTIYRMSKSSGAVMGKPSILPILSVPTDESGITVSMEVKTHADEIRFRNLIIQIAKLGGMKVKLNGTLLESAPFETAKNGYLVMRPDDFGEGAEHCIQIRYGNVVYPIEINPEYSSEYAKARDFLGKVSRQQGYYHTNAGHNPFGWVLILQAQPDTISVTPSRESLSMTDHTISTVKQLLGQFIESIRGMKMRNVVIPLVRESIEELAQKKPVLLLNDDKKLINRAAIERKSTKYIVDADTAGGHYVIREYPAWLFAKDMAFRIENIRKLKMGKRGLIQTYCAAVQRSVSYRERDQSYRHYSPLSAPGRKWFVRNIIWPLTHAMMSEPLLDAKRLGVWAHKRTSVGYEYPAVVSLQSYGHTFKDYLPLLRGLVIVAHNRPDIEYRLPAFPIWGEMGESKHNLCYLVPRNKERAEAAVAFFTKQGFTVLDLTKRQPWEGETVLEPVKKAAPVKKRPKGLPAISGLTNSQQSGIDNLFREDCDRIETPEWFIQIGRKWDRLPSTVGTWFNRDQFMKMIKVWGDKGVAVISSSQAERMEKVGAKEAYAWVREKLLDAYKNNPAMKAHHENTAYLDDHHPMALDSDQQKILSTILSDSELNTELKVPSPGTDEIRLLSTFYREWKDSYYHRSGAEFKEIEPLVNSWGVNPDLQAIVDTISGSKTLRIIDADALQAVLSGTSSLSTTEKTTVRKIFLTALRGK